MSDNSLEFTLGAVVGKLEEQGKALDRIGTTLDENTRVLAVHVKRTDLAEQSIAALRLKFEPIEAHVLFMRKLGTLSLKVLGACATVATLLKLFL